MTSAGDGERLVTAEDQAARIMCGHDEPCDYCRSEAPALVALIAADLDRGGYDRARREIIHELERRYASAAGADRMTGTPQYYTQRGRMDAYSDAVRIARSSSGRAPAGEEQQR